MKHMRLAMALTAMALSPQQASAWSGSEIVAEALRLMGRGDYDKAFEKLEGAPDTPLHQRLLIELDARRGRYQEADQRAQRLIAGYRAGRYTDWQGLSAVAYAAWQLDRWDDANSIYIDAAEAGADRSTYVDWGLLYLEVHDIEGTSESILRDALTASGAENVQRWSQADAFVGMAQSLEHQGKPTAAQVVEEAAKLEARNLWLLAYKARRAIVAEEWDSALEQIETGLDDNDEFLPLLHLKAAWHHYQNQDGDYLKVVRSIEKINPRDGDLYELMGDIAVTRRRLEEAIDFYQRSTELNPRQWSAMASLGINMLRIGREEEGRRVLERAFENDSFNPWTYNTLTLLDKMDGFERFETAHFAVKLDPAESAALRPYVERLLEESLQKLSERYNYEVEDKIIFEMHSAHGDFAVRTLGLPGLGALGATFGRVVVMDSPSARPRGEFHWGSTLWHEVAHVVTLSMSDARVPRWFTEGLSMMEERRGGAGWGDDLTIPFVQAWQDKGLLPLAELNSGFVRPQFPGQVAVSYLQAGRLCEFISSEFGMEKIQDMLRAYGRGQTTEEVFEEVLDTTIEAVDRLFFAELEEVLSPIAKRLERPEVSDPSLTGLGLALHSNPENYYLNVSYAQALIGEGRGNEAIPHLERAIELFPARAGADSPYAMLSDILVEMGDKTAATQVLGRWWKQSPLLTERGIALADLLDEQGEVGAAVEVVEQVMFVDPLSPKPHQRLGDLYLKEKQAEKAIREFEILLAREPVDPARVHYSLARALDGACRPEEARRHVLMSLEIAPGYRDAQQLLLKLVEPSEKEQ